MTGDFLECAGKKYQFGFQLRLITIKELRGDADILKFFSILYESTSSLKEISFCSICILCAVLSQTI